MTYARMEYVQSDHYDMNIEPEGSFDLRPKRWKWVKTFLQPNRNHEHW